MPTWIRNKISLRIQMPYTAYMSEKECSKCHITNSLHQFNYKDKNSGRRNARCRLCTREDVRDAYYRNRAHYLNYRARRNKQLYREGLLFVYNYLSGHPCVDCGFVDPRALQFDHVRGEKRTEVSNLLRRRASIAVIKSEIDKCEVRCANCHSVKTARERNYYVVIGKHR